MFRCLSIRFAAGFVAVSSLANPVSVLAAGQAQYWISVRGVTEDDAPAFVEVKCAGDSVYSHALQACGLQYFLTISGMTQVQAALSSGDTVQVHRAAYGIDRSASGIICLVQRDQ